MKTKNMNEEHEHELVSYCLFFFYNALDNMI